MTELMTVTVTQPGNPNVPHNGITPNEIADFLEQRIAAGAEVKINMGNVETIQSAYDKLHATVDGQDVIWEDGDRLDIIINN